MRGGDPRSKKVAIVPDCVVNAPAECLGLKAAYEILDAAGAGLIALPSPDLATMVDRWIEITIDQVQDYRKHGYSVLVVGVEGLPGYGVWYERLAEEYRRRLGEEPVFVPIVDQYGEEGASRLRDALR